MATTGSHDHVARSSIQKSRKWWNLVRFRVRVRVRVANPNPNPKQVGGRLQPDEVCEEDQELVEVLGHPDEVELVPPAQG